MAGSIGNKIFAYVGTVVIVLTAVCAVRFNQPQYIRYQKCMADRARLIAENEVKYGELSEYRINQERFVNDPDFIEQVARKNRMLFPGEILFTFPTPDDK